MQKQEKEEEGVKSLETLTNNNSTEWDSTTIAGHDNNDDDNSPRPFVNVEGTWASSIAPVNPSTATTTNAATAAAAASIVNPLLYEHTHHGNSHTNTASSTNATFITRPQRMDVIVGRGKSHAGHPGNAYFYHLIDQQVAQYATVRKSGKTRIIRTLVDQVLGVGGRFVRFDKAHACWHEVSMNVALAKTSQAIRYRCSLVPPTTATTSHQKNNYNNASTTGVPLGVPPLLQPLAPQEQPVLDSHGNNSNNIDSSNNNNSSDYDDADHNDSNHSMSTSSVSDDEDILAYYGYHRDRLTGHVTYRPVPASTTTTTTITPHQGHSQPADSPPRQNASPSDPTT
jgi:hypothetical protein